MLGVEDKSLYQQRIPKQECAENTDAVNESHHNWRRKQMEDQEIRRVGPKKMSAVCPLVAGCTCVKDLVQTRAGWRWSQRWPLGTLKIVTLQALTFQNGQVSCLPFLTSMHHFVCSSHRRDEEFRLLTIQQQLAAGRGRRCSSYIPVFPSGKSDRDWKS